MYSTKPQRRNTPIDPFWNRIPGFFLYALNPLPLLLSLGLALISYFFTHILLTIIIYAVMLKYCFVVLEHTSEGKMKPPPLNTQVLVKNYDIVLKQLAVFILFAWMLFSMASIHWLLTLAVMMLGYMLLPASVMVLATTESLIEAMNPILLLRMVGRIGWSYLGLFGLLLVVSMAEANLQGFLFERVSQQVLLPVYNAVNLFFSVIMFHMMGYVLYQSHEALGYTISKAHASSDPLDDRLLRFRDFMQRNLPQAAKAELEYLMQESPQDPSLQEKYCTLLLLHGSDDEKQQYAQRYIPSLITQGRHKDAARVFCECVQTKAAFPLNSVEQYKPLMRVLRSMGKSRDAVLLTKDIHRRFPHAPEVADIYLESARMLSEELDRDEPARTLLKYILKRFPDHPCRHESLKLQQLLQQID